MSRLDRQMSSTEAEPDLLSPFFGFGYHDNDPSPSETSRSLILDESRIATPFTRSDPTLSTGSRVWRKFHGGWRSGVAAGALGAVIVLIINVCLLIWVKAKYHVPDDGSATVFRGSCAQKTKISVWCHLAINVCSTLLLSASNNTMQVLTAPTRADVDHAHGRGFWLDVGIPSMKNLRMVGWKRVTLWAILGLSSIPLHLL